MEGSAHGLTCYQCANTDGKLCPFDATTFTSSSHDACITWKLGNGSVILQVRGANGKIPNYNQCSR